MWNYVFFAQRTMKVIVETLPSAILLETILTDGPHLLKEKKFV
jgi:hypothetical protein